MAEFSAEQFYGFSMHNDPELLTTTKNFEFRYTRPEFLEKVIQKVQSKDESKSKANSFKYNCSRVRKIPAGDTKVGALCRDADIETHMERLLNNNRNCLRTLSDKEIDHLIDKAKSKNSLRSTNYRLKQTYDPQHSCKDKSICARNTKSEPVRIIVNDQNDSEHFEDVVNDTDCSVIDSESAGRRSSLLFEEIRKPQAQWVEIVESNCKGFRLEINVKRTSSNITTALNGQQSKQQLGEQSQENYDDKNHNEEESKNGNGKPPFKYFDLPLQNYEPHCLPAMLMNEVLTDNIRSACALNVQPFVESITSTLTTEDSDLEYELQSRPNYFKLYKNRPKVKESKHLEKTNIDICKFLEAENDNDANTMYLKNAEPLQFTEITEEVENPSNSAIKFAKRKDVNKKKTKMIKSKVKLEQNGNTVRNKKTSVKHDKDKFKENYLANSKPNTSDLRPATTISTHTATTPTSGAEELANSTPSSYTKYPLKNTTQSKPLQKESTKSKTKRRSRPLIVSKSIEDLKTEKAMLFSKMTNTQEKIIEMLDKLRLSLLDSNMPESSYEKSKRQKNAFEFSVRFSRNFLYPLKGMLHELEFMPESAFTCVTSNDACCRIYNIFNLLLQSLITYQKQLRYFLLDQVPQKLTTLIEMTHNAVSLCLSKQIFSQQDLVIDCLQHRCAKFLEFLTDMHEGRLEMIRKDYRKLTLEKAHTKYDLKMFMNDLNMYEPKLVPKTAVDKQLKRKLKNVKPANSFHPLNNDSSQDVLIEKPTDEKIFTKIQDLEKSRSSASVINEDDSKTMLNTLTTGQPNLDKSLIQALQHITKEQVRQILEPIFDSLGSAIGNQRNNLEVIETLVNVFNVNLFTTLKKQQQQNTDKCQSNSESNGNSNAITDESATSTPKVASLTELQTPENLKQRNNATAKIQANATTYNHNHNHGHSDNHSFYNSNNTSSKTTLKVQTVNHDDSDDDINTKTKATNSDNKMCNLRNNEHISNANGNACSEFHRLENYTHFDRAGKSAAGDQHHDSILNDTDSACTITTSTTYENINKEVHRSRTTVSKLSISRPPNCGTSNANDNNDNNNKSIFLRSKTLANIASRKRSLQPTASNHSLETNLETKNSTSSMSQIAKARFRMRLLKSKRKSFQSPPPPPPGGISATSLADVKSHTTVTDLMKIMKCPEAASNCKNTNAVANEDASNQYLANPTHTPASKSNIIKTASGTSYIELYHKRLPASQSPYPSDESADSNTEMRSQIRQNQKPKVPPKPQKIDTERRMHGDSKFGATKTTVPNIKETKTECKEIKSNLQIDQMIQEREKFLELCSKNRFYRNPNYAEPWKVFSSISEKLINDVLTTVETDFSIGVSKFVEDFLELETRSNDLYD